MFQGSANPGCSRFGQTMAFVPFQPNTNPDGTANPLAGKDNAILYGATVQDPGGLPLGTLEYLTFDRFFNVAGQSFTATLHLTAPAASAIPAGTVALTVPTGWTVDAAKPIGPVAAGGSRDRRLHRHAERVGGDEQLQDLGALHGRCARPATRTTSSAIVPAVEGRFHRWGKYAEFDQWLNDTAPQALRLGRSAAVQSMGMGETISLPVDVHNWSTTTQSGTVTITAPADFTLDATSKPYGPLAPGADATVMFTLTNTDTTLPGAATNDPGTTTLQKSITIATSYSTPAVVGERDADDDGRSDHDHPGVGRGARGRRPGGRLGVHRPGARPQPQVVRRQRAARPASTAAPRATPATRRRPTRGSS